MRLIILNVVVLVLCLVMRGACKRRLCPPKGRFMTQLNGDLRPAVGYTGRSVIVCGSLWQWWGRNCVIN